MANENLARAQRAKNDEFYTQYPDIERELQAYINFDPDLFRDKTVLLPCDDPEWSEFTRYLRSASASWDSASSSAPATPLRASVSVRPISLRSSSRMPRSTTPARPVCGGRSSPSLRTSRATARSTSPTCSGAIWRAMGTSAVRR